MRSPPPSPFFHELVDKLRDVRLDSLPIVVEALQRASQGAPGAANASADALAAMVLALPESGSKLETIQRAVIDHALATTDGNVSAAARLLGMERKALERKVARYKRR